jgi:histidinol phosphatase-like enzyme (inositol monophosphatase family)
MPQNEEMAFEQELAVAREASEAAVEIARRLQPEIVPEVKPDASPVTEADRQCERAIVERIRSEFPDDGILAEEGSSAESRNGRKWIIDPIDGTRDFVRGTPLWANLIALEQDGEVVLGVVNLPCLGWFCHAVKGAGAYRNGKRMRVSTRTHVEESIVCANAYRYLSNMPFHERLLEWMSRFWAVRGLGGAADAMMVAGGEVEVWIEPVAKPWDFAPLKIIGEEAGAMFFNLAGGSDIYSGSGLLCVPPLEAEVRAFFSAG